MGFVYRKMLFLVFVAEFFLFSTVNMPAVTCKSRNKYDYKQMQRNLSRFCGYIARYTPLKNEKTF